MVLLQVMASVRRVVLTLLITVRTRIPLIRVIIELLLQIGLVPVCR